MTEQEHSPSWENMREVGICPVLLKSYLVGSLYKHNLWKTEQEQKIPSLQFTNPRKLQSQEPDVHTWIKKKVHETHAKHIGIRRMFLSDHSSHGVNTTSIFSWAAISTQCSIWPGIKSSRWRSLCSTLATNVLVRATSHDTTRVWDNTETLAKWRAWSLAPFSSPLLVNTASPGVSASVAGQVPSVTTEARSQSARREECGR